ncbi:MAG: MerR family transcriptional regulator [Pseudomonadota bacterium]
MMRISDVARETGLSVSAIRYYERRSVIRRPNRNGQNRDYSEDDVRALRFVRNARSLNIPVRDIADILQRPWNKGDMAAEIADQRRVVQSQIDALRQVDGVLAHLETCMCEGVLDCELADGDD